MPCYIRMKRTFLQGLLWLYLLGFGFMALSLEPGFLDFDNLPDTNFSCVGKVIGGYYADLETNCQMFHVCTIGQLDEPMDIRFLCLNGTVFDQETRVCERIDEVDCSKSEQFYSLNLELYGNTQPANLEEIPETDQPLIIKSTTTTTTTTAATPKQKTSRPPFYNTVTSVTTPGSPQVISTHHFPVVKSNSPDIRFNPEEINISLHPGAPPDIRTKPISYQQHGFSDHNKKVIVTNHGENSDSKKISVTTHAAVFDDRKVLSNNEEQGLVERPKLSGFTTQKPQSVHDKTYNHPTPSDINYGFTFHQTEPEYHTETPRNYHFHTSFRPSYEYADNLRHPHSEQYKSSSFQDDYMPTTSKVSYQQKGSTTLRNYFLQSLKPPSVNQQHHYAHLTEEPQRVQLPLPLLPTLPPLTFSSPAPFSLQRHVETKRYTKDHHAPPRIIISASASVSDASGRRLNYSLGTIGAAHIFEQPPQSYDEYKDEDVALDPFYHDVPKIKHTRRKRQIKHSEVIKNDQEASDVLKFLYDWYKNNEKTTTPATLPVTTDIIAQINDEFSPKDSTTLGVEEANFDKKNLEDYEYSEINFQDSDLFNKKSKYSIIGDGGKNRVEKILVEQNNTASEVSKNDQVFQHEDDYVNDNYEPSTYQQKFEPSREPLEVNFGEHGKNFSIAADYVDDNNEPIYYKERTENVEVTEEVFPYDDEIKNMLAEGSGSDQQSFQEETKTSVDATTTNTVSKQLDEELHDEENATVNHTINDEFELQSDKERYAPTDREVSEDMNTEEPASEIIVDTNVPTEYNMEHPTTYLLLTESVDIEGADSGENSKPEQLNEVIVSRNQGREAPRSLYETTTVSGETTEDYESFNPATDKESDKLALDVTAEITLSSTSRPRNNGTRGRRRFNTPAQQDTEEVKNVFIEKITEKPYRAKDDFIYLKTVSEIYSSTTRHNPSEVNDPPTTVPNKIDDEIHVTFTSAEEQKDGPAEESDGLLTVVEKVTTTRITTEAPKPSKKGKRRRGKQRQNRDPNRKRRRKNRKHTDDVSTETLTNRTNTEQESGAHMVIPHASQIRRLNNSSADDTDQRLEIVDTVTKHTSTGIEAPERGREIPKETVKSTIIYTAQTTPTSHNENHEVLGTTQAPSTESLDIKQMTLPTEAIPATETKGSAAEYLPEVTVPNFFVSTEPVRLAPEALLTVNSFPLTTDIRSTSGEFSPTVPTTLITTENLQQFVPKVEAVTKSVVVTENVPQTEQPTVTKNYNQFEETGPISTEKLTELIEEIQDITKSVVVTTTMPDLSIEPEKTVHSTLSDNAFPHNLTTGLATFLPGGKYEENLAAAVTETVHTSYLTTPTPLFTRRQGIRRGTRPTRRRTSTNFRRPYRHRFSTELFTRRTDSRRQSVEDEIIDALINKSMEVTTSHRISKQELVEEISTDAPIQRSASPTQAKRISDSLPTTPLSRARSVRKHFVFNCFSKEINKFYPDPRDCRLFHYCTPGYTRNQLLDMKFVCELNTYFDDEKLICTKLKPKRCV